MINEMDLPEDDEQLLDFEAGREDEETTCEPELLTIQLFKQAIRESAGNADDQILVGRKTPMGMGMVRRI